MKGRSSFDDMIGFICRSKIMSFIDLRFNTDVPDLERANRMPLVLREDIYDEVAALFNIFNTH